jgi:hypothetical protein
MLFPPSWMPLARGADAGDFLRLARLAPSAADQAGAQSGLPDRCGDGRRGVVMVGCLARQALGSAACSTIEIWGQDEVKVGQKGGPTYV